MGVLPKRAKIYIPESPSLIKGCVQIIHGMAEHQGRYKDVAEFLKSNGFVVVTSDLRGHGDNVDSDDDLGHFGDVPDLVGDVKELFDYLKEEYPGKPLILIGHSMGTLISTCYFKIYGDEIDGLILSGMPGFNPAAATGKALVRTKIAVQGLHHRSRQIAGILNGPFAKAFPNEIDPFAWLSVDKDNIKRYHEDPKCGFLFTLRGYLTLLNLMTTTYGKSPWLGKRKDIPVRLISGANDPCRVNDATFMKSVTMFRLAGGYHNVTFELIPGQRHEIFNDTKREETLNDLLEFINTNICK